MTRSSDGRVFIQSSGAGTPRMMRPRLPTTATAYTLIDVALLLSNPDGTTGTFALSIYNRAGADGIIIEGNEAGGHIGPVSTSVLAQEILPVVRDVPVFVADHGGSSVDPAFWSKSKYRS